MRVQKLTFINGLSKELKRKLKAFNDYLVSTAVALKTLDKIKYFESKLIDFERLIRQEQFLLFKFNEIAWPENIEEWKKFSVFVNNKNTENNLRIIAFSYSLKKVHEVIPPFSIREVSIFTRKGREEMNKNEYDLEIDRFEDDGSTDQINTLKTVYDTLIEFLENSYNTSSWEKNILLTDIPFSNIDFINSKANEKNKAFELTQNFIVLLKSLNIIPVSLVKSNGSPLVSYIIKVLESLYENQEEIKIEVLNDKIYLADKLRVNARSPMLSYTNSILENPYVKEKCYIFYLRCDHDYIQRVEIPQFALKDIELIHSVLLQEYSLSKRKLRTKGFYSHAKAKKNLIIENMKKEEMIRMLDLLIKDEMIRNYKKRIGLISNFA